MGFCNLWGSPTTVQCLSLQPCKSLLWLESSAEYWASYASLKNEKLHYFLFYLYRCVLVWGYNFVSVGVHKGQKKSELLEQKLHVVVSWYIWVLKTKLCFFKRELSALHHWVITPAQNMAFNFLHQLLLKSGQIVSRFLIGVLAW